MKIKHPLKEFIWVLIELIILIGADSLIRYENSYSKTEEKIASALLEISHKHKVLQNEISHININEIENYPDIAYFDEKTQKRRSRIHH